MGIYSIMFFGGLILAILFLALSVVLFFVLDIPTAFGSVTGSTQRKALEEIRSGKTKETKQQKKRKSQSGLIRVRNVKASSSTGSLMTGFTDIQKKAEGRDSESMKMKSGSGAMSRTDTASLSRSEAATTTIKASTAKADRDASSELIREAELAAARAAGVEVKVDENEFTPEHLTEQDIPTHEVETSAVAVAEESATATEQSAEEKKNTRIRINPKTGKRYELDAEETEVLTYNEMTGKEENPTSLLGAKIPGEDEETDVLRADIDSQDLYDKDLLDSEDSTDILTSGLKTDLDEEVQPLEQEKVDMPEEDTDVLISNHIPQEEPDSYFFAEKKPASEDETDVLQGEDLSDVEVAETETVQDAADKARPKPSFSITDMLRHAMEEGKNIPDIEEDEDDYDEDEDEVTSVLTGNGIESGKLSQSDVHGTLDENLTSVLKADMMPDAEEKKPTIADVRIKVLYDATIVHTDESL